MWLVSGTHHLTLAPIHFLPQRNVDPRRYSRCMEKLRLHRCSSDQISDFVLADHVIDVGESVYAGIDLTVDPMRYASKVWKAVNMQIKNAYLDRAILCCSNGWRYLQINKEAIRRSTEDFGCTC